MQRVSQGMVMVVEDQNVIDKTIGGYLEADFLALTASRTQAQVHPQGILPPHSCE